MEMHKHLPNLWLRNAAEIIRPIQLAKGRFHTSSEPVPTSDKFERGGKREKGNKFFHLE